MKIRYWQLDVLKSDFGDRSVNALFDLEATFLDGALWYPEFGTEVRIIKLTILALLKILLYLIYNIVLIASAVLLFVSLLAAFVHPTKGVLIAILISFIPIAVAILACYYTSSYDYRQLNPLSSKRIKID